MHHIQQVIDGVYWIGGNDFRTKNFENFIPIPQGITYNSYFIDDDKTAVIDTVDAVIAERFLENVEYMLHGRSLDYIVINHMEPDHSATLLALAERYPEAKLAGSPVALRMFEQFFHRPMKERYIPTNEKMEISLGKRHLRFINAPMVHWPEVTFTYDAEDRLLFSADAFGTFGTLTGSVFADAVNYPAVYEEEARRYYTCIVSKYGTQVLAAMKKAAALPVDVLCPLHGPVFRTAKDLAFIWNAVERWAGWTPEIHGTAIFFASIYGNTAHAAERLAWQLRAKGADSVKLVDLCRTDYTYAMADAMQRSHLVFAAPTYNMGLYPVMRTFMEALEDHGIHGRRIGIIGNSSWAPNMAGKIMKEMVLRWKDCELISDAVHIQSAAGEKEEQAISVMADALAADLRREE